MSDSEEADQLGEFSKTKQAGKRNTSKQKAEMEQNQLNQLKTKLSHFIKVIRHLELAIQDKSTFDAWDKNDAIVRTKSLESLDRQFQETVLQIVCFSDDADADREENDQIDELIASLQSKLMSKKQQLSDEQSNPTDSAPNNKTLPIEVQQTDATGNIPNTWGFFNGEYSQWPSFHDRWVAAMHENTKVKTIVKFQNLKAACIGAAAGVCGEWDLTDENYAKAWARLKAVYEDDYMQAQEFMRKLSSLPQMQNSSSKSIRQVIDTVQKHIHGLQRYIKIDEAHPYVVFAVIERMDSETYRAWEKFRPTLGNAAEDNAIENQSI